MLVRAALTLTAVIGASLPASAQLDQIRAETVVTTGLATPLAVTHAGDDRLFVSQLGGQVAIVRDGALLPRLFLDLSDQVQGGGEGLFSIAFHPDYANNGFFFVHYAAKPSADSVISRFEVSSTDPDRSIKVSERVLLRIPKQQQLHYGGQLAFGPDGFLYVSTGDGTDRQVVDPACTSQSLDSLEGKVLRIDVDQNVDTAPYYAIPADNPFVATPSGEVWALGLRNPWRFSFDRENGDMWLTDVGHDRREEINREPAASPGGRNYGWKVMEGDFCFNNRAGCPGTVPPCDDPAFTRPTHQYPHAQGRCSIIGGYVYRGRAIPDLYGKYLYADHCTGEILAGQMSGGAWQEQALGFTLNRPTSFGEDAAGEIWITTPGALHRLVGPDLPGPSDCVADANHLCLNRGRFRVSVDWRTAEGLSGLGRAVSLGEDAGMFWFFSENNPEVFVKVLDACFNPFNHYWVFAAGLTEVETSLVVVDTQTGDVRQYDRALGQPYDPIRDTRAFATCP